MINFNKVYDLSDLLQKLSKYPKDAKIVVGCNNNLGGVLGQSIYGQITDITYSESENKLYLVHND